MKRDRSWRALSAGIDDAVIMGILNVTPDSFSDGGEHATAEDAAAAGWRMVEQGAKVIDVGGESTRPGALAVDASEQIRRIEPVIRALAARQAQRRFTISIDTTLASVASAAIKAGAEIINDTSAGLDDPDMLPLAASEGCGLTLMHRLRQPRDDSYSTQYAVQPVYAGGVYAAVRDHLRERVAAAIKAGVSPEVIVIDPGLGFGKSIAQNYELAARLGELQRDLGQPALSAASRKSFLAHRPGESEAPGGSVPPRDRLGAGVAMTIAHWGQGIRAFRVHDVMAHWQALTVTGALADASGGRVLPAR